MMVSRYNNCLTEQVTVKAVFEGFECRRKVLFRGVNCFHVLDASN